MITELANYLNILNCQAWAYIDTNKSFLSFKIYLNQCLHYIASQVALVVKNPTANAKNIREACQCRDVGSIPGLERSPGRGHGNPLQFSCLENPMDWRTWWATVHRVAKRQTWLKCLSSRSSCINLVDYFERHRPYCKNISNFIKQTME